jgi:hypothetical protein
MFETFTQAFVALSALAGASSAHAPGAIPGWTVGPPDPVLGCTASGPASGSAQLLVVVNPNESQLMILSPDLPADPGEHQATVSVDGGPTDTRPATGSAHVVILPLAGTFAQTVANASTLTASVEGHTFRFKVAHIGQAFDAAARCANAPTLAEREKGGQ